MPSGSSDHQVEPPAAPQAPSWRYGPVAFAATALNVLVLEFLTWVYMLAWYMIPFIVLPIVVVDALIAWGLTRGRGAVGQVGRGMLIGCIAAPLTVLIFTAAWAVAQAIGSR